MTTIVDVVYRANGQGASGTMVITWPGFTTQDNKAVAAGELSVAIGSGGAITVQLAPNAGSIPAGTYYKVVYKLSDGTTSVEYWVVPASSPTTIGAIRATVVPTQVAAQLASRQYVDNAVAGSTDSLVHKTGDEAITGTKTFAVSPSAPAPANSTDVANKNYVDTVVNGITGAYVHTTGDTMTGQLTLASDPVAPGQAANRHYVDLQTSTLTAGLSSKLGRINDSPVTLAGVRYADQFAGGSVGAQIDAACADLGGVNGSVVIPSTMGAGWSLAGIPTNCNVVDWRGNGGSTQTAYSRGWTYYGRYTQVGANLQIVSPMLIEFDAYAGGVNNIATTKTQWQGIRVHGTGRTIGERKGIQVLMATMGKGDSIGVMASSYDFGGYHTGGDEGSEGGRFSSTQGDGGSDGGFPRGSVTTVAGNTVTGSWTSNANLGEARPLINTSRGVYNTGSVASVNASGNPIVCTVVGSGTAWGTALGTGAKTDLFLEITGNSNGTTKHVVPVASITDDTHLVVEYNLAELGPSCYGSVMTTSGVYNIYKGGKVASLAAPPSGSLDPVAVNLASGGTNFQSGDTIQQPLGYNYHGVGAFAAVSRLIGEPQGSGMYAVNTGTMPYRDGYRASGKFVNGISFDSGTLTGHGVLFTTPVTGSLLRSNDTTASTQDVYNLLNASGTQRKLTYDRTHEWWLWSGGQYFSATDSRFSIGASPNSIIEGLINWGSTSMHGLWVENNSTPSAGISLLKARVAGVDRFSVENSKAIFNNGIDAIGYSDDGSTQKWKIMGATGAVTAASIALSGGTALATTNQTGTGNLVLANSPAIVTPTIASFTNAAHDHSNAAGGGQISTTAVAVGNKTGSGTKFATGSGTYTSGDCISINSGGDLVDNGAACGGAPGFPVNSKTASYSAVSGDFAACKLITMSSSSATTLTLLSPAPSAGQCIQVKNIGAGMLTVSRNGLTIDGAGADLMLGQSSGTIIVSDGSNYFSQNGSQPVRSGAGAYKMLPYDYEDGSGSSVTVTANQVKWMRFYLPFNLTVSNISWTNSSCAGSGSESVGIYSADGATQLVSTAAHACAFNSAAAVTATTLPAGFYIYAWTSTSGSDTFYGRGIGNGLLNYGGTNSSTGAAQTGTAGNSSSGGALPSSLGTLTASAVSAPWIKLQG